MKEKGLVPWGEYRPREQYSAEIDPFVKQLAQMALELEVPSTNHLGIRFEAGGIRLEAVQAVPRLRYVNEIPEDDVFEIRKELGRVLVATSNFSMRDRGLVNPVEWGLEYHLNNIAAQDDELPKEQQIFSLEVDELGIWMVRYIDEIAPKFVYRDQI